MKCTMLHPCVKGQRPCNNKRCPVLGFVTLKTDCEPTDDKVDIMTTLGFQSRISFSYKPV